jgi:hypothetical protein
VQRKVAKRKHAGGGKGGIGDMGKLRHADIRRRNERPALQGFLFIAGFGRN